MRKYLLLVSLFFICASLISLFSASTVEADHNPPLDVNSDEDCWPNVALPRNQEEQNQHCAPGLVCERRTVIGGRGGGATYGRCVPGGGQKLPGQACTPCGPNTKDPECIGLGSCTKPNVCGTAKNICYNPVDGILQCGCKSERIQDPGGNGFSCAPNRDTIDPNAPAAAYCQIDEVCTNENEMDANVLENILETPDNERVYPGKILVGVKCIPKGIEADCKCIGPNGTDQENKMECIERNPNKPPDQLLKGTGFCGSAKDQCQTAAKPDEHFGDNNSISHPEGALFEQIGKPAPNNPRQNAGPIQAVQLYGVACRRPEATCECINNGRPGNRINGFICNQFNRQDMDFCDKSYEACVNDPAGVVNNPNSTNANNSGVSQKRIFAGAPLRGIRCAIVPTPVPPKPPCYNNNFDAEGRCLEFMTAFGVVAANAAGFITSLFGLLLASSGGLALLLIMRAGYLIMTSAGNQERLKNGREQLVAAVVGLLFIIFSFVILQVIGVDILRIPGMTP